MNNNNEKSFGKFMTLWSGDFISAIGSGLTSFGLGYTSSSRPEGPP